MPYTIDDAQEHPIIFNEWSIQRILEGAKTQTRRLVKNVRRDNTVKLDENTLRHVIDHLEECPYGQPGDVLWVREAFRIPKKQDGVRTPKEYAQPSSSMAFPHVRYEADGSWDNSIDADSLEPEWGRKRPSIHMPKEFSRLRLQVEEVRVERVQEISPADAHAEGIPRKPRMNGNGEVVGEMNPVGGFKKKWREIHGDGAWGRNDWVWVIEFARYDE